MQSPRTWIVRGQGRGLAYTDSGRADSGEPLAIEEFARRDPSGMGGGMAYKRAARQSSS